MPTLWTCPCPDCPPTEFAPVAVPAFGDEVAVAVCGGACGLEHPRASIKRV